MLKYLLQRATEYGAADAHQTMQLVPILKKALHEQQMEHFIMILNCRSFPFYFAMEAEGIYLDTTVLKKLDVMVTKDLETVRTLIVDLSGEQFKDINLNSPKQVEQLLFYELKLPTYKKSTKRRAIQPMLKCCKNWQKYILCQNYYYNIANSQN